MGKLRDRLALADPDGFYESLIHLHEGLTDEQSRLVMAKLVLLLANHIGDAEVLDEALRIAREDLLPRRQAGAEAA